MIATVLVPRLVSLCGRSHMSTSRKGGRRERKDATPCKRVRENRGRGGSKSLTRRVTSHGNVTFFLQPQRSQPQFWLVTSGRLHNLFYSWTLILLASCCRSRHSIIRSQQCQRWGNIQRYNGLLSPRHIV